jgi:hypothetical protein
MRQFQGELKRTMTLNDKLDSSIILNDIRVVVSVSELAT